MWDNPDEINISIDDASEGSTLVIKIGTPVGEFQMLGEFWFEGNAMHIDGAHVGSLDVGALGRKGLNAIGRKLLEVADVKEIHIQGSSRTTGANKNRPPRPIRFPHP